MHDYESVNSPSRKQYILVLITGNTQSIWIRTGMAEVAWNIYTQNFAQFKRIRTINKVWDGPIRGCWETSTEGTLTRFLAHTKNGFITGGMILFLFQKLPQMIVWGALLGQRIAETPIFSSPNVCVKIFRN